MHTATHSDMCSLRDALIGLKSVLDDELNLEICPVYVQYQPKKTYNVC